MSFDRYTGGFFQTHAYALPTASGRRLLIDAPEGVAEWLRARGDKVDALLLTHAHVDHIHDAAAVVREHGCPIFHHRDGDPLLLDRDAYKRYGISIQFEPVAGGQYIDEGPGQEFAGWRFDVLLVPGHCPGSLCFYDRAAQQLFGGDVLFAGSIGRTDLPGGNLPQLLSGLHEKVLTLPDETVVLPGHGPATTVGVERIGNPFLT
jgi:glyoxylase-like metal-dependent hydrolase (beta-lactamase superfamily II)